MSRLRSASLLLAIPATLISQTAWADLTPAEVWGDWREYMENMGYTVEAEESTSGDTLTVSDVTMRMQMPEDGGSFSMSMGTLTFVQGDNGAVEIRMPEKMPMSIDIAPEGPDDEPVSMVLTYGQSGPQLTASGSPDALQYDYAAETISLTLAGLKVGEESYGEDQAKFSLIGTDVRVEAATDRIGRDIDRLLGRILGRSGRWSGFSHRRRRVGHTRRRQQRESAE